MVYRKIPSAAEWPHLLWRTGPCYQQLPGMPPFCSDLSAGQTWLCSQIMLPCCNHITVPPPSTVCAGLMVMPARAAVASWTASCAQAWDHACPQSRHLAVACLLGTCSCETHSCSMLLWALLSVAHKLALQHHKLALQHHKLALQHHRVALQQRAAVSLLMQFAGVWLWRTTA